MADDGLTAFLNAEPESAGDTSTETPTSAPEPTATETEGQQAADTGEQPTGQDNEPLFNSAEFLKAHPEVEPLAKQLQADYTRKMQAIAEQRKALEGLQDGDLNWLRTFNSVAATSPQAAAQMLAQVQQELLGQSAASPEQQQVPEDWDLMTDTERQLAQELRQFKGEFQQFQTQQRLASDQALVRQQLDGLEAELGVQIPYEQRVALWNEMQREGIPVSYAAKMWKATQGWEHARRLGRDEGAKSVQAKQALPAAPSGIANRAEMAPPNKPKELADFLEMELAGQ